MCAKILFPIYILYLCMFITHDGVSFKLNFKGKTCSTRKKLDLLAASVYILYGANECYYFEHVRLHSLHPSSSFAKADERKKHTASVLKGSFLFTLRLVCC